MEILNYSFDGEGTRNGQLVSKTGNQLTTSQESTIWSVTTRLMSFSYLLPDLAH